MYHGYHIHLSNVSTGVNLEEQHLATETLNRRNSTFGKVRSKLFRRFHLVPQKKRISAYYLLTTITKANSGIATGNPIIFLYREYHDEKNRLSLQN